jgi:hypothetical protein
MLRNKNTITMPTGNPIAIVIALKSTSSQGFHKMTLPRLCPEHAEPPSKSVFLFPPHFESVSHKPRLHHKSASSINIYPPFSKQAELHFDPYFGLLSETPPKRAEPFKKLLVCLLPLLVVKPPHFPMIQKRHASPALHALHFPPKECFGDWCSYHLSPPIFSYFQHEAALDQPERRHKLC